MAELPDDVYTEIQALCARGDELVESGEVTAALDRFNDAWQLLPEPKNDWAAATWILAAIGDTQFTMGKFAESHEAFRNAAAAPEGFGNPFIHLRLGQTALELGETREAANELTRAYGLEGAAIFESQDAKYFQFLKTQIKPPSGGWQ